MIDNQLIVQSIAIIALGLFAFSFHTKTRKNILFFQLISFVAWFIHFYLLSAWTGALLILVNAVITIFFIFRDGRKWIDNYIFLSVSIIVLAIATTATWEGYFSIFAFLAIASITIAKWQKNPDMVRKISIFASVFWILYDSFAGSYGGIISESIIIFSILLSLHKE